ncbi:hypothetical protein [Vibrio sp. 1CM23M]|uniref:hypothetical protein n=1 Tax=Vibrio sp. 1CM23M TaxID=2929164 RepID=UPI0020BED147|nr:hypothetical protein [Vibrio sp. 1CM23M]MCK8072421.1 hypothetical protein [Vibrio sp. 1CM23M]
MKKSMLALAVISSVSASAASFIAVIQYDENTKYNIIEEVTEPDGSGDSGDAGDSGGLPDGGDSGGLPDGGDSGGLPDGGGSGELPDSDRAAWENSKWYNPLVREFYLNGQNWARDGYEYDEREPFLYSNELDYNPFNESGSIEALPPIDSRVLSLFIKDTPESFSGGTIDGNSMVNLRSIRMFNGFSLDAKNLKSLEGVTMNGGSTVNLESHSAIHHTDFHISGYGNTGNTLILGGGDFPDKEFTLTVGELNQISGEPYNTPENFSSMTIVNMPSFQSGSMTVLGDINFVNAPAGLCNSIENGDIYYEQVEKPYTLNEIFMSFYLTGEELILHKPKFC